MKTKKEYMALISMMAYDEDDFMKKLDALDSYELEFRKGGYS